MLAIAGDGVVEGLVDGSGSNAELVRDLAGVDDERLLELVLHLEELAHGGVEQAGGPQEEWGYAAESGAGLACVPVDEFDELPRGAGVGVVGEVPRLAGGVGVFAEDGEAFADVGNVGIGVRLVGVAERGGGLCAMG